MENMDTDISGKNIVVDSISVASPSPNSVPPERGGFFFRIGTKAPLSNNAW